MRFIATRVVHFANVSCILLPREKKQRVERGIISDDALMSQKRKKEAKFLNLRNRVNEIKLDRMKRVRHIALTTLYINSTSAKC